MDGIMSRIEAETGTFISDKPKTYIGDGVYAVYDGFAIILATDRGADLHWMALEPQHLVLLNKFMAEIAHSRETNKPMYEDEN